jgi:DNA-binding NarL/FixJ family response regulator
VEDIDLQHGTVTIEHLKSRIKLTCPECSARLGKGHTFCQKCGANVGKTVAEQLAWQLAHGNDKPLHQTLSDREYEVLCMIASGKTVKEIAE